MIAIRLDSPVPLGEQLVDGLRQLIAAGTLTPGDELPPVRQLAADLGVNLNTVARAYRELEQEGLAAPSRGRGTRITADRTARRGVVEDLKSRLRTLFAEGKLAGLDARAMQTLAAAAMAEFWPDPPPAS